MSLGKTTHSLALCLTVVGLVCPPGHAEGGAIAQIVQGLTDRLERVQYANGMLAGAWPGEEAYTGSIVSGLVAAYELTCDEEARVAAIAGGDFILRAASGNYYGDEAYALMCLSRISANRTKNHWRSALVAFYGNVRTRTAGGTPGYVAQFDQTELSRAVFYLAHHTMAAFYVDAPDKAIWRDALVDFLARTGDDSTGFPVMALALATWALANTGPLDATPVDPDSVGDPYWRDVTLAELPDLLRDHQVVEGPLGGGFYGRFDHGNGAQGLAVAGYADDLVFGALGLLAVSVAVEVSNVDTGIVRARNALVATIGDDGVVPQHLWYGGDTYLLYAGYALRAVAGLTAPADVDLSNSVDAFDLAALAANWQTETCQECGPCNRADTNADGHVDEIDLQVLGDSWLVH